MSKLPLAALSFVLLAGCSGALPRPLVAAQEGAPEPVAPSASSSPTADETATLERALARAKAQVVEQQLALEAEIYAREDAERRADEAARCLVGLASVEADPRGIVIAFAGSELFDAGKATLRAASSGVLAEVANLLLNQNSTHSIVVHAGEVAATAPVARALNAAPRVGASLADRRAEALRGYFIGRGVDAARITTHAESDRALSGRALVDAPLGGLEGAPSAAALDRVELVLRPPSTLSARAE